MTDVRTQRNLAVGAAVAVLAVLIGFLLGRGTGGGGEARPELGRSEPGAVAPAIPAAGASATAVPAAPAPAAATPRPAYRPPAAAPSRPAATERPAGERWSQEETRPTQSAPVAPAPRPAEPLTVPDGTQLSLALTAPLSSQTAQVGDAVEAELTEAVAVDGRVALAAGTRLSGRVTEAHALAKIGGQARLAFSFDSAVVDGREVPIAAHFAREGKSETGKDAATIAAGTAIGIILGNQSKHNDRGKVIGGVLGGAAGTGVAAATKGETIELPAGTELRLTLRGAVIVTR